MVDFYKENSSYSTNWLGRVMVEGGLAPNASTIVSFLWKNAPFGSYNITVRVDISNNETAAPPVPDRINEVDEWNNNQMSKSLLLVPEFQSILAPFIGILAIFGVITRMGPCKKGNPRRAAGKISAPFR
jgi:hypothetical protein